MKTFIKIACVLFTVSFAAPSFADEVGPGKPSTQTQSTQLAAPTTECSLLDLFLGNCQATDESDES